MTTATAAPHRRGLTGRTPMLNACELEIDLFCKGLRVPPGVPLEGARGISRTRAGLGSGLELVLPGKSWLKDGNLGQRAGRRALRGGSPYRLDHDASAGHVDRGRSLRNALRGTVARRTGVVPLDDVARDSHEPDRGHAGHLSRHLHQPGLHVLELLAAAELPVLHDRPERRRDRGRDKAVADVVETCRAARDYSGVTFVHLNGGFQGSRGIAMAEPYVRAIKKHVGMLVGVQLAPEKDFSRYDRLIDLGVDHLSFCVELLDPAWFARICPGKDSGCWASVCFFDAMEYCARRMPHGAVSGEIIAGIEPVEHTLEAIDIITAHGAFPTVCIFRPTIGSDMEDWPPPSYEDMRIVMRVSTRHAVATGSQSGPRRTSRSVSWSIRTMPRCWPDRDAGFYGYEAWRRLVRIAARPIFRRRMKPVARPRRALRAA